MPTRKHRTTEGEVVLENGNFAADQSYETEITSRLRTHRGSLVALPTYGSRLHTIKKATADAPVFAQRYAEIALKPMVEQRKLRSVTIEAELVDLNGGGRAFAIDVYFRDREGRKQSLRYNHRLGT